MGKTENVSFGHLVIGRTISESFKVFASRRTDVLLAVLSLAVGFGVRCRTEGWKAAMTDFWPTLETSAVVFVIFFISVVVWNLWLAPAALAYEVARERPVAPSRSVPSTKQERPPIDWGVWKRRAKYEAFELAAILAKEDPIRFEASTKQQALARLISEALNTGTLERTGSVFQLQQPITGNSEIEKQKALEWAKKNGFDTSHVE